MNKLIYATEAEISAGGAKQLLRSLHEFLDVGLKSIKSACIKNNKLDPSLLDDHQLTSYELAFCEAEISAANSFLDHTEKSEPDALQQNLALLFAGDIFQSVMTRLKSVSSDAGLDWEKLAELEVSILARALLKNCNAESVAKLGAQISEEKILRLPSGLDEEKELVRDTFLRFADEVVAPLAEEIHREDKDIPEEIIRSAADLGCFGTCIPERFGGLQPDEGADSLSMIVVTEELSRASLGAAGSLITRPEIAARALIAGGTESQQLGWLPRLAAGEILCAISITEPNTGSDVAAVSLKAKATKGGWILNGSKTWCTFAGRSELIVVLCRTNSDISLGFKGLSMFLVEKPSFEGREFEHSQEAGGTLTGKVRLSRHSDTEVCIPSIYFSKTFLSQRKT